jgi:hypothetical protein
VKITTKTTLSLSICLSLLFGTQANTQAVPVARYGVNAWLSAETIAATTARRAAANDARYWPATAANDASFKVAQANTITAMESVAKVEAANASKFSLTSTDVIQMAGFATLGVVGAPTWMTLLLTAAVIGVDVDTYFSNKDGSKISVKIQNTASGARSVTRVIDPIQYSPPSIPAQFAQMRAYGGILYKTSICLASNPCAAFPTQPLIVPGYPFVLNAPIKTDIYNTIASSDVMVRFKSFSDFESYLKTISPLSWGEIYRTDPQGSTYRNGDPMGGTYVNPLVKIELVRYWNADLTNLYSYIESTYYNKTYIQPYSIGSYHIDTVTTTGQMVFSDVYRTYNAYAYGPLNDSNYLTKTGLQYRYDPLSDTQPYYQKTATNITTDKAYQEATASPELMANLLNKLWLKASQQPGYRGLPYSPTNPITAADLSPQAMPLLADLLSQILNPVGEIVLSQDGINPDPIVVNNPDKEDPDFCQKYPNATYCKSRDTQIDLSAPDAQTPKLESVPTALNILKPIIDLILPYKNVSIFKPSIQCPKSSFEALSRTWILDAHCDMFESIRSLLSAVMLTVFAVACFRIVMKA